MTPPRPALQFESVVKRFGRRRALDGLTLTVRPGCRLGLVGANGAGKTTLIGVAAGFLRIDDGMATIFGLPAFDAIGRGARIGVLPQDARFPPQARIDDLLRFYARLHGIRGTAVETAVGQALDRAHLADRCRSHAHALSHGMHRRLSIAQAMMGKPDLVLLDEPLAGLDPSEAARMRTLLRDPGFNSTWVISSHHLPDIESLCDEVAFVDHGRCPRHDATNRLVRRDRVIVYRLGAGTLPVARIREAFPAPDFHVASSDGHMTIEAHDSMPIEAMNARALPILIAADVGIIEIQAGDHLEKPYFDMLGATPPIPEPMNRTLNQPQPQPTIPECHETT